MAKPLRVYWDTCVWLRLIKGEQYHDRCEHLIAKARAGEIEIWTSTLTLAEAWKKNCGDGEAARLPAAKDIDLEDFLKQDFIKPVQVDMTIASRARQLCRSHTKLNKAADGIHLASAVLNNCDEFHTTDNNDLLPLNGKVSRKDGENLLITLPPPVPPPAPGPEDFELVGQR